MVNILLNKSYFKVKCCLYRAIGNILSPPVIYLYNKNTKEVLQTVLTKIS